MTIRSAFGVALAAAAVAATVAGFPALSMAAESPSPATASTPSAPASGTVGYDLDFTLPTAAKAGCTVCHGDPNLTRLKNGRLVNYYVDPKVVDSSAHNAVLCTGCHLDFAYAVPHTLPGTDWRLTARSECKNCHQDQYLLYGQGAHRAPAGGSVAPTTAAAAVEPLCGDCHGSHEIVPLTDNPSGAAQLHDRGWDVCGRCHEDYWDNYEDYYHGAAYKRGATDAPACWDCHEPHDTYPADDVRSSVNARHLAETCSKCHDEPGSAYLQYAEFIHGREKVREGVWLYDVWAWVRSSVARIFGG